MYTTAQLIILSIFSTISFLTIPIFINKKIKSADITLIFIFTSSTLFTINKIGMDGKYRVIIGLMLVAITMRCLYNETIKKTLFKSILFYVILSMTEITIMLSMSKLSEVDLNSALDFQEMFRLTVLMQLLFVSLIFIYSKIKLNKKEHLENVNIDWIWIIYLLANLILIGFNTTFIMGDSSKEFISFGTVLVACVMNFSFIIYSNKINKNKKEIFQSEIEKEMLKKYNEVSETLLENQKIYRHRQNNILTIIESYLIENEIDGLKNYIDELIEDSGKTILEDNIVQLNKLKQLQIKALINNKLASERFNHIKVIINESTTECVNLKYKYDIMNILGVFIDNSLEEIEFSKNPELHVLFIQNKEGINITIINEIENDRKLNINELKEKGYSSKGNNRGIGLYDVKKIIDKNQKLNNETYIKDNKFYQELKISL